MATTTQGSGESSNNTAIIVLALVVLAAVILGAVFLTGGRDNSVTSAVKEAPAAVGNTVDNAADKVTQ